MLGVALYVLSSFMLLRFGSLTAQRHLVLKNAVVARLVFQNAIFDRQSINLQKHTSACSGDTPLRCSQVLMLPPSLSFNGIVKCCLPVLPSFLFLLVRRPVLQEGVRSLKPCHQELQRRRRSHRRGCPRVDVQAPVHIRANQGTRC